MSWPRLIALPPTTGLGADRDGLVLLRAIAGRSADFGLNLCPETGWRHRLGGTGADHEDGGQADRCRFHAVIVGQNCRLCKREAQAVRRPSTIFILAAWKAWVKPQNTPMNSAKASVCQAIGGVSLNRRDSSAKVWKSVVEIFDVCISAAAPARSGRRPRRAIPSAQEFEFDVQR